MPVRAPKIEVLELKDDLVRLVLSETDTSVANALRRVLIAEVPTMSIDLVTFYDNTSALQDEYLAHRLGLVPLRVEQGVEFDYNVDCECEDNCEKCSVMFTLDVSYAKKDAMRSADEKNLPVYVTSHDLQSLDPRVTPVHFAPSDLDDMKNITQDDGIMLAKLSKGQRIQLQGIARKGIAKEHAKWSPVCTATYQFDPEVEINQDVASNLTPEQRAAIVESCPAKVYDIDNRTGALVVSRREECMYCDECTVLANALKARPEDDPVVTVRPKMDRFIFTVETNGSMRAEDVVTKALEVLRGKLMQLRNELVAVKQDAASY